MIGILTCVQPTSSEKKFEKAKLKHEKKRKITQKKNSHKFPVRLVKKDRKIILKKGKKRKGREKVSVNQS
jgi:hypothetical protein